MVAIFEFNTSKGRVGGFDVSFVIRFCAPRPPTISSHELGFWPLKEAGMIPPLVLGKRGEFERSFFQGAFAVCSCVGMLFISTLFGDVRFSTKPCVRAPCFAKAHKR